MIGTLLLLAGVFGIATMLRLYANARRERQRWENERKRIAAMHEQLARDATRPNGHVDYVVTRHD